MMRVRHDERGAVALLTTVIISILLAIITTGLITLMISELRQSVDSSQANKAYYAAQSGVEEGVGKVVAALNSGKVDQLCPASPAPGSVTATKNLNLEAGAPGQVGWTCQQITYSGSPEGSLPTPDKAVQIDIGSPSFNSIVVEWDQSLPPFPANFFNAPLGNFPTQAGWNHAAALELAIIKYPLGSFSASAPGSITLTNALMVPRLLGNNVANYQTLKGNNPIAGVCNPAAVGYHCRAVIDRFNGAPANYILRLRSRYVGTDYKLTFTTGNNGSGSVVRVPDGTATIDVTAKAGDAFRRVIYKVPYRNTAAAGLDFVIYSDTDICKNFGIINGSVSPSSIGCPY